MPSLPLLLASLLSARADEPERPSDETLQMLTAAVGQRVANHAGHPFDHLPELVLAQSSEVAGARRAVLRDRLLAETTLSPREVDLLLGEEDARLGQHVGLYVHAEDRIYLFEDNIEAYVAGQLGPVGLLEPYVVCTLAHELTHALQFQVAGVPAPRDPLDAVVVRSVREGHANLVGEAVCRELGEPAVIGFDRGMQGIDALASRPRTLPDIGRREDGVLLLHYGYGQRYVERLVAQGGLAAAWAELSRPTVDLSGLLAGALDGLPPDTRTPAATRSAVALLVPEADQQSSEDFDTVALLAQFGPPGLAAVAEARGAWRRERWTTGGGRVVVSAIRFEPSASPVLLIGLPGGDPLSPWESDPSLARRARVDALARRTRLTAAGPVEEIWAARGDLLLVVQAAGVRARPARLGRALRAGMTPSNAD